MVVFTCGHCGESVQKPKVEKHYQTKCRNRNPNLSCMDCFKDFFGNDYESHTKCITEEERYSAKGFQAKEKKGEKRQNTWVEMLQEVLDEQPNAPRNVLRIIETVSKHNNTPRKKPKFINFVKNVCGHKTNPKDIDQAWDLIAVKLSALSLPNQKNKNQSQKNNKSEENGKQEDDKNDKQDDIVANGETETENTEDKSNDVEEDKDNVVANSEENPNKKLSKKQRKEEKKRKKYEAALQSAEAPLVEEEEEMAEEPSKKGKKKKTKSECNNGQIEDNQQDGKNKNKKRKRQDTVNSQPEVAEKVVENENEIVAVTKVSKKKLKVAESDELEDSVCLHDQNVAKIEELTMNSEFNWHAVIRSVLQKKDNEMPFKRLQKKVLMEYSDAMGREVDDRIADKFIKKLKSAPNVRVDKNRVTLLE